MRKKKRRNLFTNPRGFSSIVGAIFAVLIMFSLISTVFVWSLSQNAMYNNAMAQNRQLDLDRSNEKITANVTCLPVGSNNDTVAINGTLENSGSLAVQIVTAWATDFNRATYAYNSSLNIALKPGTMTTLVFGTNATLINLDNSPGDSLGCWFITARGNTISEESSYTTIVNNYGGFGNTTWASVAQGIGAFSFDFTSFKYYNVTIGTPDRFVYSSGKNSYTVPWGGYIAFSFNLTNLYPNGQNITLDGRSEMWSYFPSSPGQANGPLWFIANVNTTAGTISSTYSPITLPFNVTQEVFFAKQIESWDNQQKNQLGAINLLMYGRFGTGPTAYEYAQNIPFVSVNAKF
jgi:archaellum component FlaF (FlaF/FlaG flagellin family)